MNSTLASKISSFCVGVVPAHPCAHDIRIPNHHLRNSPLLPAWTQVRGVSRDVEALRAIRALNLNILDHKLLRSE